MDAQMPHNIEQVRAAIDNIDAQLISLLAERQSFVARAGEVKAGQGTQDAYDSERVESILRARREQALDAGLDPEVAERVWKELIAAFTDYEQNTGR
ncbi:chorismate mutase [Kocuria sp. cx-455]|uniref:chorismate mutase n=1 Tax=Kocuria sp. cx-455 TaxID=2771377 RepID=UPI001686FCDC|nr:chorismate mutase [Kocuria sp. cx-455]MBD2766073.1 chorismate mutase [Kocuria sp. cx-455]